MLENKGGRGLKAKYSTVVMRVPEVLKDRVQLDIDRLYKGELEVIENPELKGDRLVFTRVYKDTNDLLTKEQAMELANSILSDKKSAKVSLQKLLQVLYKDNEIKL